MVKKKTWDEFRETGLLLFVNHFLHIFGWSIVVDYKDDGTFEGYPARVKFRGFSEECEDKAFEKVTEYMRTNANDLMKDIRG